jgi:hypothetical protein
MIYGRLCLAGCAVRTRESLIYYRNTRKPYTHVSGKIKNSPRSTRRSQRNQHKILCALRVLCGEKIRIVFFLCDLLVREYWCVWHAPAASVCLPLFFLFGSGYYFSGSQCRLAGAHRPDSSHIRIIVNFFRRHVIRHAHGFALLCIFEAS